MARLRATSVRHDVAVAERRQRDEANVDRAHPREIPGDGEGPWSDLLENHARGAGSKIVETEMEMSGKHNFPGRLFIVEEIDGSGKSTQLSLLHRWLESEGHELVFSEWDSSPLVKKVTRRGKKMVEDYGFKVIDASHSIDEVFADLKAQVSEVLTPARPLLSDSLGRLKQFRNGFTTRDSLRAESLKNSLLDTNGGPSGEHNIEPPLDEIWLVLRR